MPTYQKRGAKTRAIVRRKGFKSKSKTFGTLGAAKAWGQRIEREFDDQVASGPAVPDITVAELIGWHEKEISELKRISATQRGNLTRIKEGLGEKVVQRLTSGDVIEHARRRVTGMHLRGDGTRIPACSPATMNVELGYLSELLKLAAPMKGVRLPVDPVAEARPALRLMRLVSKSKRRDRRPTQDELDRLRAYFTRQAWRMKIPMNDIIDFAIGTAKRQEEITRLLRSDLEPASRTALLRDAKHPRKKDGNHRRFALLGDMWTLVERQPTKGGRIFPYNSSSIGTAFTRACAKLGIEDLHFHDLRHEATSRLFEAGYDIPEVASVTLHESWNELKRYTQLRPESLHRQELAAEASLPRPASAG